MEKEKIKEKIMEHLLEFNEFILEEKNKKPYAGAKGGLDK